LKKKRGDHKKTGLLFQQVAGLKSEKNGREKSLTLTNKMTHIGGSGGGIIGQDE